jgi:hypothetical protein
MTVKMSPSRQTTVNQRGLLPALLVVFLLLLQIQQFLRQALVLLLRVLQVVLDLIPVLALVLLAAQEVQTQVPAVQEAGLIQVLRKAQVHQVTPVLQLLRAVLVPRRVRILPVLVHQVVLAVQEPLHQEPWEPLRQMNLSLLMPVSQDLLPQDLALRLQVLPGQAAQLILPPGIMNSLT